MLSLVTDLAYLVTALWESATLRRVIRLWSDFRYRTSGTIYAGHIAHTEDYGAPLRDALQALPARPRRFLDVSTGTGYAAHVAMSKFPEARSYACDLSTSMLSAARVNLSRTALIRCDSAHLPFGNGTFDLVLLQNAPPPLRELARVTAPGGWVVLGFSAAGRLPPWLPEKIVRRLAVYGLRGARWIRAGRGLYIVGRLDVLEDPVSHPGLDKVDSVSYAQQGVHT